MLKNISKTTVTLLLAMILTSCNGFSSPSTINPTDVMRTAMSVVETEVGKTQAAIQTITPLPQTEEPFPTIINTAFYTPIPTDTATPTSAPTAAITATEPVPFTSLSTIFMNGVDGMGENIYGVPPISSPFWVFRAQSSDIGSFHFTTGIAQFHFAKNELTPTPTAIPASRWQLLIYRYRTDEIYDKQPALKTNFTTVVKTYNDRLATRLSADVMMKDLQTQFGDCSAFTFQIVDEQQKVQEQGYFSINPHQWHIKGNLQDGFTIGYQYSLIENEMEFFRQGKFVAIYETQSGFYRLTYWFDFVNASGVSATTEQEEVASKLSIRLFPYREDGNYSVYDSHSAIGTLTSGLGLFIVDLPIDYLLENVNGTNKYYLQVIDENGKVIKDEYFVFIPYAP